MMVGRDVLLSADIGHVEPGAPALELEGVSAPQLSAGDSGLNDVSLTVREGEIIGVAGVSGNGQGDLVDAIAAIRKVERGRIRVTGTDVANTDPRRARDAGLAHIAEDRMHVGLNREATLEENAIATAYRSKRFNVAGILKPRAIHAFAARLIADYTVRGASPRRIIGHLSGGNLQKIVIGRELDGEPTVILANQPTRGLDVGSIEFVHRSLLDARDRGAAILLVSAELEEIVSLSDRIVVMYDGTLAGPFDRGELSNEQIGALMAGHDLEAVEVVA
jgi:simple sugar transport system ATP-binding protein